MRSQYCYSNATRIAGRDRLRSGIIFRIYRQAAQDQSLNNITAQSGIAATPRHVAPLSTLISTCLALFKYSSSPLLTPLSSHVAHWQSLDQIFALLLFAHIPLLISLPSALIITQPFQLHNRSVPLTVSRTLFAINAPGVPGTGQPGHRAWRGRAWASSSQRVQTPHGRAQSVSGRRHNRR